MGHLHSPKLAHKTKTNEGKTNVRKDHVSRAIGDHLAVMLRDGRALRADYICVFESERDAGLEAGLWRPPNEYENNPDDTENQTDSVEQLWSHRLYEVQGDA